VSITSGLMVVMLGAAGFSAAAACGLGTVTLSSASAERLCLGTEAHKGRRPVLVVYAIAGEVGAIEVAAETGEEALVGLFPGGPFKAATPKDARRSFLPGEVSRCWRFALEGEGTAEIAIELYETLGEGQE